MSASIAQRRAWNQEDLNRGGPELQEQVQWKDPKNQSKAYSGSRKEFLQMRLRMGNDMYKNSVRNITPSVVNTKRPVVNNKGPNVPSVVGGKKRSRKMRNRRKNRTVRR